MELQWISKVGISRLMESQIRHPPASSVVLCREGSEKGQWPLPTFLSGRKLSLALALVPDTSVPPQCATGAFQAAIPVLELRGSESKIVCGFFKRNCLGLQKFLPLTQFSLVFAARTYGNLSPWHWNPRLGVLV